MTKPKANGKTNGTAVAVKSGGGMQAFDASKFMAGADNMARVSATSGRSEFLRMDKQGDWYFGVNDTPVEEHDKVYIDPMGAVHGWQCWANTDLPTVKTAALLGSEIVPAYEPLPVKPDMVPATGRAWDGMAGLSMLLDGHKLTYTTTSLGGLDAVAAFANEQKVQFKLDPTKMVAVVNLKSDWYTHKKWGKTYVPVIEVIGWVAAPPVGDTVASTAAKAISKAKAPVGKPKAPLARPAARR